MPRYPSADGSRRKTFGKRLHRRESWVLQYYPEAKRQSRQWKSVSSPRPKKARMQRSQVKVMLITFVDHQEMHQRFVPQGQTVNQHFYNKVLTRLVNEIRLKRRASWAEKKLDLASQQCSCPHSPQRETVLGLERNHHVASSTLFAGLILLRFLSFSKAERDSQGDTLPRSLGYQDLRD